MSTVHTFTYTIDREVIDNKPRIKGFNATDQHGQKCQILFVDDKLNIFGLQELSPFDRLFNAINNHQIFFK